MIPSPKTKKILIVVLITMVLILFFDIFFISSMYKKRNNVTKLRGDFLVELKKEKQLDLVKKIIKETETEQSNLNSCFVNSNEVVDFIKSIELISELAGVSIDIKSIGVEDSELIKDISVETLAVGFVVQGSWNSTFKFLSLIENISYNATIDKMSISKFTDEKDKKDFWKSSFTIKAIKI
ncbi:hypothetical protein KJ991_02430 [Patescibacteria group bacterium]|nr:hypothetical protein [Patescibacteria group bacterium]MBU4057494.1 hypothetical protein [Patescibacteria group bacterium]MBU4115865.1 hypothetical protein [Patescibacteria group bacterium]